MKIYLRNVGHIAKLLDNVISPQVPRQRRRRVSRTSRRLKSAHWVALMGFAVCAIAGGWLLTRSGITWDAPQQWIAQLSNLGWVGITFFISLLAIAIVISPIPSTPIHRRRRNSLGTPPCCNI
ncbi:MAG: hypothetical protein ACFCU8_18285 [Thermosynechococcaceae cyanobacterium]